MLSSWYPYFILSWILFMSNFYMSILSYHNFIDDNEAHDAIANDEDGNEGLDIPGPKNGDSRCLDR